MASAEYKRKVEEGFKELDELKTDVECKRFIDFVETPKLETLKIQHSAEAEESLRLECEKFLNNLYASIAEAVRVYEAGEPTEEINLNEINGKYHSKND